jgi:hypothetical protein
MKTHKLLGTTCLLAITSIGLVPATAAKRNNPAENTSPAAADSKLATRYADMLKTLETDIQGALPTVDQSLKDAFMKACETEMAANTAVKKAMGVANSKGTKDKDAAKKALEGAQQDLVEAQAKAQSAAKALLARLEPFLASDKLDARLVKAAVLAHATPRGLAEFAQQGAEHEALVDKLLGDDALMKQMLVAGGAKHGKYGEAMRIYTAIQEGGLKTNDDLFQRLALATALEHAVPIEQNNPASHTDAPAIIDPVKRHLHYQKAWLEGELDPAFKTLNAWELRMVVNCDAPDHILAWGREILRNYRPDHMRTSNPGWRYSMIIKTDVLYGSKDVGNDRPTLQQYQNIIANGGVCGRRAFFGRFILRSFGIPVWGVTQKAHAAVGRWTPDGWVVNLGAAFKWSWWDKDETSRSGSDFLLETQAREADTHYLKVLRAQWISDVLGETDFNDRSAVVGGFWSNIAQYQSRAIAAAIDAKDLGTVGEDIAESNESKEVETITESPITKADRQIVVGPEGYITIPAVALTDSDQSGKAFIPMAGASGGTLLHCNRDMKAEQHFEYRINVPKAGKYTLTANVVTVQSDQKLLLTTNGSPEPLEIALPYTMGMWDATPSVEVTLAQGQNILRFTRPAPSRGVTINVFILAPAR